MSVRLDCPLMARFKPQAPHPLQPLALQHCSQSIEKDDKAMPCLMGIWDHFICSFGLMVTD